MQSIVPYHRGKLKAATALLAVVAAASPIAVSIQLAMREVAGAAHARAGLAAEQALSRAHVLLRNVALALETVERDSRPRCSGAHVDRMRASALATRGVEEIGYAGAAARCTSWGTAPPAADVPAADFVLSNGMAVTRDVAPAVEAGKTLTRLQYGAHYALLDPASFAELPVGAGMRVAVAGAGGQVLGAAGPAADRLAEQGREQPARAPSGLVVRRDAALMAIAEAPAELGAAELLSRYLPTFLLGALGSALALAWTLRLARWRLSPEAGMREAIRRREFIVHYQPIVALASGVCTGVEALVRWRRADGSLIAPDRFIPFAEESGLVMPITDQVVATVMAELGGLLAARSDLHVAINVSAQDVQSGRILEVLEAALVGTGVRPRQIWLEVTERGMRDHAAMRATLLGAHRRGYRTAIDDFGTGYSSLACLQGLPLDVLKIDKSFVGDGDVAAAGRVLAHIIALGKSLDLKMVAEGIETPGQAAALRAQGVDYGQGWHYARAMPAADLLAWLRAG